MKDSDAMPSPEELLHAKLTLETASIPWRELQRFFAAGKAVSVAPELDLIAVATALADDDRSSFEPWAQQKLVMPVTDDQAGDWFETDATVWAVVVAPWVLVQLKRDEPSSDS